MYFDSGMDTIVDNLFTHRRLKLHVDIDTQISITEQIINVLKLSGGTGVIDLKISSLLIKKIKSLQKTFVPEEDPQRSLRMRTKARKLGLGVARVASKMVKSQLKRNLILHEGKQIATTLLTQYPGRVQTQLKVFSELDEDDIAPIFDPTAVAKLQSVEDREKLQEDYMKWNKERFEDNQDREQEVRLTDC